MTDNFFDMAQATALRILPSTEPDEMPYEYNLSSVDGVTVCRFYQDEPTGLAVIVAEDGSFLLVNERVPKDAHIAAFLDGRRTDPKWFTGVERSHPDFARLVAREESARVLGYTKGDVNHNVQPIIGMLRLRQRDREPLSEVDFKRAIEALTKATYAETAWLAEQDGR
ncbi:hypothetical protein [Aeromicrobium sp. 179-A 4D2 NHS]|uniref:hypothetical protein n=1 Tax=Aeromicrobium sp. 179-A 4D2 NHS TaxID=3142375 RepID=UPI0039A218AB